MSGVVKKELSRAKKPVHPNSRKSLAIIKKSKKITNRQKAKAGGLMKQSIIGDKMLWIQDNMEPDICPYTPELTAELLQKYIARNDEEQEQIAIKHSIGGKRNRQHASREDVLRMSKNREIEEYETCGIEIPDILTATQCTMLRTWDGDLRYLPKFKFRKFGKKHLEEELKKRSKQLEKSQKITDNGGSEIIEKDKNIDKNIDINSKANTVVTDVIEEKVMDVE